MVDAAEPHQKLTRHGQVLPETITGKELGWKPSNNNEGNCMIDHVLSIYHILSTILSDLNMLIYLIVTTIL